jgi:hypothetical protein
VQPLALAFLIPFARVGRLGWDQNEVANGIEARGPGEEQRETIGYIPVSEDS